MSGKRKRVVVSLETKFNAIKRVDNGESIKNVAAELGVGEVTVGDWRRKREDKSCHKRLLKTFSSDVYRCVDTYSLF